MVWSPRTRIALGTAVAASLAVSSAVAADAAGTHSWRIVYRHITPASYSSYDAVAVSGRMQAWAVGVTGVAGWGSPIAAYWHHGKWSVSPLPSNLAGGLVALSADAPGDAWAVSVANVLHWHWGRWTVARWWSLNGGPPGNQATGITAFSPTNVWVFGGTSHWGGMGAWHLRGHTWTRVRGVARNIFEASALSPTNMWAIGGVNAGSIVHYTNGKWRQLASPALAGLRFSGIFAKSPTSVWATASPRAGSTGARLVHLSAGRWTAYPIPWHVQLYIATAVSIGGGISSDGHGGFWIPTESYTSTNWMLHFNSGKWSRIPIGTNAIRSMALIPGTRSLWSTGEIYKKTSSTGVIWAYGRP